MKFTKVLMDVEVNDKQHLFEIIAQTFKDENVIQDTTAFVNALNEREATVSTGLIQKIAIPHGKSDTVNENGIVVVKLANEIEYETLDGSDVQYVFALAVSGNDDAHLETLSNLSMKLMEQEYVEALYEAKTAEDIERIFA